jgi:hypothetical protein
MTQPAADPSTDREWPWRKLKPLIEKALRVDINEDDLEKCSLQVCGIFAVAVHHNNCEELVGRMSTLVEAYVEEVCNSMAGIISSLLYAQHWVKYEQTLHNLNALWKRTRELFDLAGTPEGIEDIVVIAKFFWEAMVMLPHRKELSRFLMQEMENYRRGETASVETCKDIIRSLLCVSLHKKKRHGLYDSIFETPFLSKVRNLYKERSATLVEKCADERMTLYEYTEEIENKVISEEARCRRFGLPAKTVCGVIREVKERMAVEHMSFFKQQFRSQRKEISKIKSKKLKYEKKADLALVHFRFMEIVCG